MLERVKKCIAIVLSYFLINYFVLNEDTISKGHRVRYEHAKSSFTYHYCVIF